MNLICHTPERIEFEAPTRLLGEPIEATAVIHTWDTKGHSYTRVVVWHGKQALYSSTKAGAHVVIGARWAHELVKRGFHEMPEREKWPVREDFEAAIWIVRFRQDEIPFEVVEVGQTSGSETTTEQTIPY